MTPPSGKQRLVDRIKKINRLFAVTVVIPTALATMYFGFIASDVYISESRFVVRSPERSVPTSAVGALLQGTGLSHASDDAYSVIDYIQSRDALAELNKGNYIRKAFGEQGDAFDRFPGFFHEESFEALLRYYQKEIVDPEFETTSSITTLKVSAFNAADAHQINERLLELSERLVNKMNARAADDSIQFAQREANIAADRVKDATVALARYRNSHTVFDPDKQSALQLQQVAGLQAQLFEAQAQLAQIQSVSPANPQVGALRTTIATIQKQIESATSGIAGNEGSLSEKAVAYERLQLDAQFAQKQLTSALGALELARAEAQRKQLYLERIVEPSLPDAALEPRRIRAIFATFVLGLITWGVLSLLIAGMKEHQD
jgi:capsular polysaccharide transport system permease protein